MTAGGPRASDAILAAVMRASLDGVIVTDADGRVLEFNLAAEAAFGRRRAAVLGRPIGELIAPLPPHDARGTAGMGRFLAGGAPRATTGQRIETRATRADGSTFPVELAIAEVLADGRRLFAVGLRDLTGQHAREEALRASEAFLRDLLDDQTDLVFRYDSGFRIVFCNEVTSRVFGVPREAQLGTLMREWMLPEVWARLEAELRGLTPSAPPLHGTDPKAMPNGEVRWFEWTNRAIFDEEGRVTGYQSVGRDITERRLADLALAESEARLAAFMEHAPLIIHLKDREGRYLLANPECGRMFGCDPALAIGKTPFDLLPPETAAEIDRIHREVVETGRAVAYEEYDPHLLAYGWTHTIRFPICERDGRVAVVGCIALDIGERKRAEAALKASEARLAAFMEHAPVGMYLRDPDGRYVMLNPEMARVFGRPATEMLGRGPEEVLAPVEAAMARRFDAQLLERGGPTRHEEHLEGRDAYAWSMVIRFPVRDAAGRIVQIGGFDVDITAQKRALAELAASEQRFRAIAQSHPTPMMVARLSDKKAMFANEALHATFRLDPGQLPTYDRDPFYADPAERAAMFAEVAARGRVEHREVAMRRADGERFPAFLTARAITYEGDACAVVSFQDVSALKAAEEELTRSREALHQSEKLRAMGSLLAGVAHELNNPLAILVGQASMLEEDAAADGAPGRRAAMIRAAAERCARIVQTFVALARRKPPERRAIDLNEVARAALEIASYGLRTAGVAVRTDLAPGLPPLEADADQLHQVVLNLLINAQQALEAAPPPRALAVRTARAGPGTLVLEVADNGPGVPAELRPRIFEPFFTTKPPGAGMGIGLSFSHGVAEAHQGRLELVDAAGGGATFRLTLPTGAPPTEPSAEPLRAGPAAAARRTALIVDDEPEVAATLAEILAGDGHAVEVVLSGEAARRLLAERDVDLVLCDLRMPGLDGPALFDWLRRARPALAARMAFVTGDALGAGAAGFLARSGRPALEKPFTRDAVRRVVAALGASGQV